MGSRSPSSGVFPNAIAQLEAGVDRPGRIVAVGSRQPEHGHDRVAHELFERAAVTGDDLAGNRVEPSQEGAQVLRVQRLAHGGRAGHIGEQDRDEPAFLCHCR